VVVGVRGRLSHRRVRESRDVRRHPRGDPQARVPEEAAEPPDGAPGEPAAHVPELRGVLEVPSQAPRVPGCLRAGRRSPVRVGGPAHRPLDLRQGALAAVLPGLPGPSPDADQGDSGGRPLDAHERGHPVQLRHRGLDRARPEGARVPPRLPVLLDRPASGGGALDPAPLRDGGQLRPGDVQLLRQAEQAGVQRGLPQRAPRLPVRAVEQPAQGVQRRARAVRRPLLPLLVGAPAAAVPDRQGPVAVEPRGPGEPRTGEARRRGEAGPGRRDDGGTRGGKREGAG
jgi:hypothetical protein